MFDRVLPRDSATAPAQSPWSWALSALLFAMAVASIAAVGVFPDSFGDPANHF
jgi:hypothetical protein